eukprot:2242680-Prymnesium_polylepis.1
MADSGMAKRLPETRQPSEGKHPTREPSAGASETEAGTGGGGEDADGRGGDASTKRMTSLSAE